jgi:hypothetical protein
MSIKFPKSLGECIDVLYSKRADRLHAQKTVDAMKAEEALYEEHILNTFTKSDLNGAKGNLATAGIKHNTVYNVADWDTFLADVRKKKAWDCLQKRLTTTAVAARFDNGKPLAGVEVFEKVSLTLNKAGS